MKPYFAKYLPMEGKIEDGDKAIDDNILSANKIVALSFDKYGTASDGRGTYSDEGLKKLRRVKLFLCSRDIQVGDIARWYDNPIVDTHVSTLIKATHDKNIHKLFKVIGEISPGALSYVKEGDEFGKEQVVVLVTDPNDEDWLADFYMKEDWSEELEIGFKVICKIKGPCGHFH